MAVVLFDGDGHKDLEPITLTKAVADVRVGLLTACERWQYILQELVFVHTNSYLQPLYDGYDTTAEHLWIDAAVLPSTHLIAAIQLLQVGEALVYEQRVVAGRAALQLGDSLAPVLADFNVHHVVARIQRVALPQHWVQYNAAMIVYDMSLVTASKTSQTISNTNKVIGQGTVYIESGATVECCVLNTTEGPIYIGKDAHIMEGSMLRGPFAACEQAVIKMGSFIYGGTTIGKKSVAGGEIKNSLLGDCSNKAHHGYMGDSVIGAWCNWGAGTTNSNVKNNASDILVYHANKADWINMGLKCGVVMGDYTKMAINSSINTGSVYGICCNVFGAGLLPKQLSHFSWGTDGAVYQIDKAIVDIQNWMQLKKCSMNAAEISVLRYIFETLV